MIVVTRNKYAKYDLLLEETNKNTDIFSYIHNLLLNKAPSISEHRDEKTSYSVRLESSRFINEILAAAKKAASDNNNPKSDTDWNELCKDIEKIKVLVQEEQKTEPLDGENLARKMLGEKIELEKIIQADIFPCVVSIKTPQGVGTGFFKFEKWLLSNAHVLPNYNLVTYATLIDNSFKGKKIELEEYGSFHRRIEKAPDISIVNVSHTAKCLPFNEFSLDRIYNVGSVFFYVYLDHESQERKIGYIEPYEQNGIYSTYKCSADMAPGPGSSGSPVIEAKLTVGRYPRWQLKCIGAVFARNPLEDEEFLVHVISPDFDLEQIRTEIMIPHDESKRLKEEMVENQAIGNEKTAEIQSIDARKHEQLSGGGFIKYSEETILDLNFPENLEKLLGKTIIDIHGSAFLSEVQKIFKIDNKNHIKNKSKTVEELGEDLYNFFMVIKELESLPPIGTNNEYLESPKKYFRIDISGGGKSPFKFDLQDSIGNKGEHCPPPNHTVPVSSKFAIASISKKLNETTGEELVEPLIKSLTLKSKALLEAIKTREKEKALPMWRLFCYASSAHNNKQVCKSRVYNSEEDVLSSQEYKDHESHKNIAILDDKENCFLNFTK